MKTESKNTSLISILIVLLVLIGGCSKGPVGIPGTTNLLQHPEALIKGDGVPEFDELIGELTKFHAGLGGGPQDVSNAGLQPSPQPLAGEQRNMRRGFKWEWTKPLAFKVALPQNPVLAFEWGFAGEDTIRQGFKFTATVSQGMVKRTASELSGQVDEVSIDPNWRLEKVTLKGFHPGDAVVTFKLDGVPPELAKQSFILSAPRIFSSHNPHPRRIILIGVDTLRADHMSNYGYTLPTTPNIDKWAEGGTRYGYCISASPWTFPSFSSILTGRYPTVCGALSLTRFLPGDETTLAEILSREEFTTFTIINSYLVSPALNVPQGFDGVEHYEMGLCEGTFNSAREWLDAHNDEDVFLFIHLMDPHTPYQPPLEFGRRYYPEYDGGVLPRLELFRMNDKDSGGPGVINNAKFVEAQRALYDGEISYVDDQFGKFIQYIDSMGMSDDSLVVFCSDHGEEFLEHGKVFHGYDLYDEVLHVPLIMRGPGIPSGKVVDNLTGTVDIFPTILEFFHIQTPEGLSGKSLLGSIDSKRLLVSEEPMQGGDQKGITTTEYRYILYPLSGKEELYDLKDDKPMLASVAPDRRSICRGFKLFLINYIEKLSSPWMVVFTADKARGERPVYSGSIICSGGYASVEPYRFEKSDRFEVNGEVISFEMGFSDTWEKEMRFTPNREGVDVSFEFYRDGKPAGQGVVFVGPHFSPVDEHPITVNVNDARFEFGESGGIALEKWIVIYAAPRRRLEQLKPDLTPEMVEELRSLGYLF